MLATIRLGISFGPPVCYLRRMSVVLHTSFTLTVHRLGVLEDIPLPMREKLKRGWWQLLTDDHYNL